MGQLAHSYLAQSNPMRDITTVRFREDGFLSLVSDHAKSSDQLRFGHGSEMNRRGDRNGDLARFHISERKKIHFGG